LLEKDISLWSSFSLSEAKSRVHVGMAKKKNKPNSQKLQAAFYKTNDIVFHFVIRYSLLNIGYLPFPTYHLLSFGCGSTDLSSLVVLIREQLFSFVFSFSSVANTTA